MKMSMIKVSLLVVLVLAPLATQLAWAAAPAHEAKRSIFMDLRIGGLGTPSVAMRKAFRCLRSLKALDLEIFGLALSGTPLSKLACYVIRDLPASCTDPMIQVFGVPFKQTLSHCGAAAPSPL